MHKVSQRMQSTKAQHHKEEKKSPANLSSTARAQIEQDSTAKRQRPEPSRTRANFSSQRSFRLPEKTHFFRANLNIQIASMM